VVSRLEALLDTPGLALNAIGMQALNVAGLTSSVHCIATGNSGGNAQALLRTTAAAGRDVSALADITGAASTFTVQIDTTPRFQVTSTGVAVAGTLAVTGAITATTTINATGDITADEFITADGSRWKLGAAKDNSPTGVVRHVEIWIDGSAWYLYAEALS